MRLVVIEANPHKSKEKPATGSTGQNCDGFLRIATNGEHPGASHTCRTRKGIAKAVSGHRTLNESQKRCRASALDKGHVTKVDKSMNFGLTAPEDTAGFNRRSSLGE